MSVGFEKFQGAYRSRAVVMVYAAIGTGRYLNLHWIARGTLPNLAATLTEGGAAFASGMLVAIGPAVAFFVGMCNPLWPISWSEATPSDARFGRAARTAAIVSGRLFAPQTLLVVSPSGCCDGFLLSAALLPRPTRPSGITRKKKKKKKKKKKNARLR